MLNRSFLDLKEFTPNKIRDFFLLTEKIKNSPSLFSAPAQKTLPASLVFFEASTRTLMSFQTALVRENYHPLVFVTSASSLTKGESLEDTLQNLDQYDPEFFVIRCGDDLDLHKMSQVLKAPIINGGWGIKGHPTQALLDMFTLFEKKQKFEGMKLLFVGDVRFSRVFASHLELSEILNYQIGICAPEALRAEFPNVHYFSSLDEGMKWADHFMFLRMQKERHLGIHAETDDYNQRYGANKNFLSRIGQGQFVLHPGPVNYGVEILEEVHQDSRCLIFLQARNGVFIRRALIRYLSSEES